MKKKPDADGLVPLSTLRPDPQNARHHSERNLASIQDSLAQVGVGRSIVIDEENQVLAGSGTLAAAARHQLTSVRVIDTDADTLVAVRRVGLTVAQKRQLSLLDNRTAELAEWDYPTLQGQLQEFAAHGVDLERLGWTGAELDPILQSIFQPRVRDADELEADTSAGIRVVFSPQQWEQLQPRLDTARADMGGHPTFAEIIVWLLAGPSSDLP
jgi:ParB-like chromosome segregation protein Spo0J